MTAGAFASVISAAGFVWHFSRRNTLQQKMKEISGMAQRERKLSVKEGSVQLVGLLKKLGFSFNLNDMENKLNLAGRPLSLSAEEFIAFSTVLAAFVAVVGMGLSATGKFPFLVILLFVFIALMVPWQIVKSSAQAGRERLRRDVVELCAYMEAVLTAGVSTVRVLEWYAENPGLLADEIKSGITEIKTGKPIHTIFYNIGLKYDVTEADEAALILRQESQTGVSVSKHLSDLNRDFRIRREMELNTEAAKVKPKVTAVLVLFALVATGALVAGPSIQRTLEKGLLESGIIF